MALSALFPPDSHRRALRSFFSANRLRASQPWVAGLESIPVRIVELTDAQALETSIVENLQRRDVHPLEEAQGFAALLRLENQCMTIRAMPVTI